MLRNTCLAVLTVLAVAAASEAAVTISGNLPANGVATPGLTGFKTYTLMANSDDPITAVDFVGDGNNDTASGRGFFGTMNQITLPAGNTIFQDSNALIPLLVPGANAQQDSQFSVLTSAVVVPPGLQEETGSLLQAAYAWSVSPGNSIPLAQIVIPDTNMAGVNFRGAITALVNGVQTDFPISGMVGGGDTPVIPVVTDAPAGLAGTAGAQFSHQFATSAGTPPITWEGLTKVSGPSSLNAPTLSPAGLFSWNAAQAQVGTFVWDVTARNAAGTDVGRISINIVIPEPATISLIGLAMVGLVGVFRRHR
jgi:hypothetical protein